MGNMCLCIRLQIAFFQVEFYICPKFRMYLENANCEWPIKCTPPHLIVAVQCKNSARSAKRGKVQERGREEVEEREFGANSCISANCAQTLVHLFLIQTLSCSWEAFSHFHLFPFQRLCSFSPFTLAFEVLWYCFDLVTCFCLSFVWGVLLSHMFRRFKYCFMYFVLNMLWPPPPPTSNDFLYFSPWGSKVSTVEKIPLTLRFVHWLCTILQPGGRN